MSTILSDVMRELKKPRLSPLALEREAGQIQARQAKDPRYLLNSYEEQILRQWNLRQLKLRQVELGKERKAVETTEQKQQKRKKAKTIIPSSVQKTIPYLADYEEGLFEVETGVFSKTYLVLDINYAIASEEEQLAIFTKYGEFLNYFSNEMCLSITVDNRVVSPEEQESRILYRLTGDDYDGHREEYNNILKQQIAAGRGNIRRDKYITVTIEADSVVEALLRFRKIDDDVLENLRKIGSFGTILTTEERLEQLHDKFRRGHEGEFHVDFEFLKDQGISSKDYIAPSSFDFRHKRRFMIGDDYWQALYVGNLPTTLSDEFFAELIDCDFPAVITLAVQPLAQDKALRLVRKQLTGMEANKIEAQKKAIRSGYDPNMIHHNLAQSLAQAEQLLDDMVNKSQKMFLTTSLIMVQGSTPEELEENVKTIAGKVRKYTCQLLNLDHQQEQAFKVCLPLGIPAKGHLSVERATTTEALSVFVPFSIQELLHPHGFYYGLNQLSKNIIMCNRTSMRTPSGFLLGSSGSGKSFAAKCEMISVLLNDGQTGLIIIDPENEYGDFARAFGGTVVKISADTQNFINPMDMPADYGLDEDDDNDTTPLDVKKSKALKKKSEFIMSIVEKMISTGGGDAETSLNPEQKSIIDDCVRRCYKDYLDHNFDTAYIPTLLDLQAELDAESARVGSEDARTLAAGCKYYTKGSMDLFSHKTNVDVNNRFVVFNVRDLGDQARQIALVIMFDFIWNRMIENRNKGYRTYAYCDEIHVMFANYYSAYFLKQLYKRGRKYGLVITGITQNVEELVRSEMARGMVANSDFLLMLNQATTDLQILAQMLNISEAQMRFVSKSEPGSGLIFAQEVIVPFVNKFPKDSYLYKLISTNFNEQMTTADIVAQAKAG